MASYDHAPRIKRLELFIFLLKLIIVSLQLMLVFENQTQRTA